MSGAGGPLGTSLSHIDSPATIPDNEEEVLGACVAASPICSPAFGFGELYNPVMLKIECEGLTIAEVKELQQFLRRHEGVESVQLDLKLEGIQRRSGLGWVAPEQVWLIVKIASTSAAVGVVAGSMVKGAAEDAGKDLYKVIKDWLSKKSNPEGQVTLYDANGKLIEKIRRGR